MKREAILASPAVVELLVPQRPPLSLLDCVVAWDEKPRPTIRALRHISSNEAVLAGHFPELPVWPGCFTIEGLAQSCRALSTLERLAEARERSGVQTALRNLERWLRREPGYDEDAARQTAADLRQLQGPGLLVAVEVRLTRPVWPGCRLDYRVTLERRMEDLVRFEVEAAVSGEIVAHGTLTTARGPR